MSRSMLPQKAAEVAAGRRAWLSDRWAGKWDGVVGPLGEDGSLRCEMSAICEGAAACKKGGRPVAPDIQNPGGLVCRVVILKLCGWGKNEVR